MKKVFLFLLLCTNLQAQRFFQPIAESAITLAPGAERKLIPEHYETYRLDVAALSEYLAAAPMEFTAEANAKNYLLEIPTPDGVETYAVWKVMACEAPVYERHPEMRTFGGVCINRPGKMLRGSVTVRGCKIMVLLPDMNLQYLEPYAWGQTEYYMTYDRRDIPMSDLSPLPRLWDGSQAPPMDPAPRFSPEVADRNTQIEPVKLKIFRYGVACTAEFAQDHGGTHDLAWAAVVEYTNLVSALFERDIDLRLQIVPASEAAVFLNQATDPYTGTTVDGWMGQNPAALEFWVGSNNYDVGHVYARYLGGSAIGIAGGIACTNSKGRGCSAGYGAYGDPFIGVIGQEIGHQFGGGHTWNSCNGNAQRAGGTAFEPGSGSTIMSYAGACGADNVQGHADLYYHSGSIAEIRNFVLFGSTNCGFLNNTTNNHPEVSLPYQDNFFIPINTPFELNGSATDPDGDPLSYSWEEIDLGPECPLLTPIGSAPIFRSLPPGTASNRYFPKLETILSNGYDPNEQLPTVTRDMTFRLVARDNRLNGGGVSWADVAFKATSGAGPFVLTTPNQSSISWKSGQYAIVNWDVANTDLFPVNCQKVNIRLSTDGGNTYPILLAENVVNDGSQLVLVPEVTTSQARVRVDAVDNVFFDVSDANFSISPPIVPQLAVGLSNDGGRVCLPDAFDTEIITSGLLGYNQPVALDINGNLPVGTTYYFSTTNLNPGASSLLHMDFADVDLSTNAQFDIRIISNGDTTLLPISLDLVRSDFSQMALVAPADGAINTPTVQQVVLRWTPSIDADTYNVQFANSPAFEAGSILASKTGTAVDSFKVPAALQHSKIYFWRVRPVNVCGAHEWLDPRSFQTEIQACNQWAANDLPRFITASGTPTVESKINILNGGAINDVNVKQISGYHNFFKDLDVRLISPQGTELVLFSEKCGNFAGNFNFGLDDEATGIFPCPPVNNGSYYRPVNALNLFDGEQVAGVWTLRVQDTQISSGGELQGFQLEFCNQVFPSNPYLVNNNPMLVDVGANKAISTDLLLAQDAEQGPQEIVFTLVTTPTHGRLEKYWTGEMKPGDTFTQADLDNGAIRYFNYNMGNEGDYFRFTLTDAGHGFFGTPKFTILPSAPVGTVEETAHLPRLELFPNPAGSQLWLELSITPSLDGRLSLTNTAGQRVLETDWPAGLEQKAIDLQHLPGGIYWVQYRSAGQTLVKKLIKTN